MLITVLGAAAGGGFPQWNCNSATSRAVRAGQAGMSAATQSSVAVSSSQDPELDGGQDPGAAVTLLNASPDIRAQIERTPLLQPSADGPLRSSPITSVVLTNGDVDHITGLLSLREGSPFTLFATPQVLAALAANPVFNVLRPGIVDRVPIAADTPIRAPDKGVLPDLEITPFIAPGKIALYLEDPAAGPGFGTRDGDTIGLDLRDQISGARTIYLPGCAAITPQLKERLDGADVLLLDGTLYADDELISQGLGHKTGQRMGHISMSGPEGAMSQLRDIAVGRRIFIHINTSNPVWDPASPARADVVGQGWEIAYDGMELLL